MEQQQIEQREKSKAEQLAKQKEESDPMNMKTFMRIPYQRAPEDPSWLLKKKAGRKLDPIEVEEYYRYQFDQSHKAMLREKSYRGIPDQSTITKTIR